jgi:hypothetical protein
MSLARAQEARGLRSRRTARDFGPTFRLVKSGRSWMSRFSLGRSLIRILMIISARVNFCIGSPRQLRNALSGQAIAAISRADRQRDRSPLPSIHSLAFSLSLSLSLSLSAFHYYASATRQQRRNNPMEPLASTQDFPIDATRTTRQDRIDDPRDSGLLFHPM